MTLSLPLIVALLIIAMLTAGGMAVRSVSRIWLRHWAERQLRGSAAAVAYLERPHRLLTGASAGTALTLLIAGMSLGVVVVEAAEYSGSLITARLAIDSNREVFAIPGNITSPNSFGPHVLIRQGAKLVASWQDVIEELPHPIREKILLPLVAQMQTMPEPTLEGMEKKVWDLLSLQESVAIDTLLAKLPSQVSQVYSALLALQSSNLIRELPGKKFIRRL